MKHILLIFALGLSTLHAQWTAKTITHPIDGTYKVAYTATKEGAFLKMYQWRVDSTHQEVGLLLFTNYICTPEPFVEIAFNVTGTWENYTVTGETSEDKTKVHLTTDVLASFGDDFARASQIMIRIHDQHCGTDTYLFPMTGSAAAINFLRKP